MARGAEDTPEWLTWLTHVPADERYRVAALIRSADLTSIDGVISMEQEIMAHVAEGNLVPSVAKELREWTQLVYAQLCTLHHPPEKAEPSSVLLQAFVRDAHLNVNQPPQQTAFLRANERVDADPRGKAIDVETIPGVRPAAGGD